MVLDVCALILVGVVGVDGAPTRPARLTFAMARHAAVDLSQIFGTPPHMPSTDRLPPADLAQLRTILADAGMPLREGPDAHQHLVMIRAKYEPTLLSIPDSVGSTADRCGASAPAPCSDCRRESA